MTTALPVPVGSLPHRLVQGLIPATATCTTDRILKGMTTAIPTRFTDEEIALIDDLVVRGVAANRSALIRRGLHELADAERRARTGAEIAASYRRQPQSDDEIDVAMANAIALTEAEPW